MNSKDVNKQVVAVMMHPNPGYYAVTLFGADMAGYSTQDVETIAWSGIFHTQADSALDALRKVGSPDGVVVLGSSVEYLGELICSKAAVNNVVPLFGDRDKSKE